MLFTRQGVVLGAEGSDVSKGLLVPWHSLQKLNRQIKGMSGLAVSYEKNGENLKVTHNGNGLTLTAWKLGDDAGAEQVFSFVVDKKDDAEPAKAPTEKAPTEKAGKAGKK